MRHYENAPQRLHTTFKGLTPLQHYFAFTKVYICAKVAYYISPRCVHCKKVHKKQQTITSFSQKLHKSSDTKKRRRPTHKQGVRLDTRTIVTKERACIKTSNTPCKQARKPVTLQETQSTGDKEGKNAPKYEAFGRSSYRTQRTKSVHENVLLLCAHVIPFPIPLLQYLWLSF